MPFVRRTNPHSDFCQLPARAAELFNQNCYYEKNYLKNLLSQHKKAENDCSIPRRVKTIPAPQGAGSYHFNKTKL